ncbi:box C/D snoRNA protein 1 isoform X2 [Eleutherodactylus coqui]|uniref:box C/D snoRNA protein 1 isoform X2 n=1 Tax=Eleutherodactylus coqui TaxID=57060 RepID=UPI003462363D
METLLVPDTCGAEEGECAVRPKRKMSLYSLPCVKKHKVDVACSGVRDKTAFVPLSKFGDLHLLSDYRFLEDAGRVADAALRDVMLPRQASNKFLNFLKNRARRQGIDLKLLPIGFSKRKANSTFFHKKEQKFFWHLKLQFPQSRAEYTEKRVAENKTLNEILKTYIDPAESDPTIRQRLREYVRSPADVKVLMLAERMAPGPDRYYQLDSSKSLLENLKNKTVLEYPTLSVVLQDCVKDLLLVDQGIDRSPSTSQSPEDLSRTTRVGPPPE